MCTHVYACLYVGVSLLKLNLSKSFFRDAALKCSVEIFCSDEALSKENMGM